MEIDPWRCFPGPPQRHDTLSASWFRQPSPDHDPSHPGLCLFWLPFSSKSGSPHDVRSIPLRVTGNLGRLYIISAIQNDGW